ncbi:MAG: MATE family efflux transporter [Oscillospiraceae bacterium]|nr:MATE family efflux transporter [Oscillospiraceae bacterium]
MNRDLTVGNPGAVLRRFCLPLFGSVIFQQLYNIADSLVAGKFIGESALAAVGNSYEITLLFIAFAFGCNIGCSVVVSQLFGGRAYGEMKTAVTTTLIAAGALCLALMAGGLLGSRALLELIRTPEEVMEASRLYLDIYLWGLPFLFFYNIATGIFSALGDSRTPFLFLALSSTANIGVDILFVTAFDMGVAGVAWATFLCQGVSCLLALAVVFRRLARIPAEGRRPLFSASALGRVAAIAVPSILQQSFISVGNIVIQGAINGFGTGVMAGYSAGVKLNNLVVTSFTTLGNGVSNFTAQNLGAGKTERIDQGFRAGLGLVWAVCLPVAAAYLLAGRQLLCLFIDAPTQTALDTGVTFLRLLSPFYFVVSAKLTADGVLRGTGSMGRFMAATFTDLILRVTLALVLSRTGLGATGIWLAWPISWTAATVLSLLFYHTGPWRRPAGEP